MLFLWSTNIWGSIRSEEDQRSTGHQLWSHTLILVPQGSLQWTPDRRASGKPTAIRVAVCHDNGQLVVPRSWNIGDEITFTPRTASLDLWSG
jgi:hypothetical protein